jgi:hypothetical protein
MQFSKYQGSGHQELEGYGYEKGGMAKTSVEGQGPPWGVEPVVVVMMSLLKVNLHHKGTCSLYLHG